MRTWPNQRPAADTGTGVCLHIEAQRSGAAGGRFFAMKLSVLLLLFSGYLLDAENTNIMVRIGGRLRTESDLAQMVKAQAVKTGMQFSFDGAQHLCVVDTNAQAIISMLFVQTNSTYLYGQVGRDGRVSVNEVTVNDVEAIKRVVAKETSEQILSVSMDSLGRVTAATLTRHEEARDEGQIFYLKHTAKGWVVSERGSWNAIKAPRPRAVGARGC